MVQIIIARIWQMARKESAFLAYRVAHSPPLLEVQEAVFHQMPQLVQRPVIFRFSRRLLWAVSPVHSPFRGCVYDFIGVIGLVCQKMLRRDTLIKGSAWEQSAAVPPVTITFTGIPWASTAKCSLVLSPLLCRAMA